MEVVMPAGGTQQVSLKCPCTSTTLVDPVKSKVRPGMKSALHCLGFNKSIYSVKST